jgi:hypothetical protein
MRNARLETAASAIIANPTVKPMRIAKTAIHQFASAMVDAHNARKPRIALAPKPHARPTVIAKNAKLLPIALLQLQSVILTNASNAMAMETVLKI